MRSRFAGRSGTSSTLVLHQTGVFIAACARSCTSKLHLCSALPVRSIPYDDSANMHHVMQRLPADARQATQSSQYYCAQQEQSSVMMIYYKWP